MMQNFGPPGAAALMCTGRCTGQGLWGLVDQDQGSQTQRSTLTRRKTEVSQAPSVGRQACGWLPRHALQRTDLSPLSSSKLSTGGNCLLSVTQFSDLKKKKKNRFWKFSLCGISHLKKLCGPGKALETPVSHKLLGYDLWLNSKPLPSSRKSLRPL